MTERIKVAVDGYGVGERMLEGVMFDVEVEAEGWTSVKVLSVKIQPEHARYFEQFNAAYWYEKIKESVEEDPYTHLFEDEENTPPEEFDRLVALWGEPQF